MRFLACGLGLLLITAGCAGRSTNNHNIAGVVPRVEPLSTTGNPESYVVFGKRYHIIQTSRGYKERGIASWYGKDFHGKKTSSGKPYDMYGISAAHKTLPIPTYVRVTNLENQRSIIVRVDDRGPFKEGRIIDLSFTTAELLGVVANGTAQVEVEALEPYQSLNAQRAPGTSIPSPILAKKVKEAKTLTTSTVAETAKPSVVPLSIPATAAPMGTIAQATPLTPLEPVPAAVEAKAESMNMSIAAVKLPMEHASSADANAIAEEFFLQVGAFSTQANAEVLAQKIRSELTTLVRIDLSKGLHKVKVGPLQNHNAVTEMLNRLNQMGIQSIRTTKNL